MVLLAAGAGHRVGAGTNKVLLPLAGVPVVVWSIRTALRVPEVARLMLVIRPDDRAVVERLLESEPRAENLLLVDGDATRHGSERNAVEALRPDIESGAVDVVVVHDTARPLARDALFEKVIDTARRFGGAVPAVRLESLIHQRAAVGPLTEVVAVQTPQAFRADALLAAHEAAAAADYTGTDTAGCVERLGVVEIRWVPSDAANLKVTFAEDVALAERLLADSGRPGASPPS